MSQLGLLPAVVGGGGATVVGSGGRPPRHGPVLIALVHFIMAWSSVWCSPIRMGEASRAGGVAKKQATGVKISSGLSFRNVRSGLIFYICALG
jgi:hypothetical protein